MSEHKNGLEKINNMPVVKIEKGEIFLNEKNISEEYIVKSFKLEADADKAATHGTLTIEVYVDMVRDVEPELISIADICQHLKPNNLPNGTKQDTPEEAAIKTGKENLKAKPIGSCIAKAIKASQSMIDPAIYTEINFDEIEGDTAEEVAIEINKRFTEALLNNFKID